MTEQKTHVTLHSMPALYRQYRPTTFAEIIGQEHIISILQQEILKNKVAHAYLFQGPRGTGKTTTARVFAKRLNCKHAEGIESCGTCASCTALEENRALDVIEIDAASNRGIDDIRTLRDTANLAPTLGKYKLYIIDEVHMLSGPAFAALLKTLEEPPKHVIFILATTELHKVPATIASRCQLFRFKRATEAEMRSRITHLLTQEKRKAEDTLISFIIGRSDGCYRDAESLLGQLLSQSEGTLTVEAASNLLGVPSPELVQDFLSALVDSDTARSVSLATQAYSDGFDPEQFLHEAIRQARDGIIQSITGNNPPAFATGPNAIQRLTAIMRAFLVATQDLAFVPEPMIAIELAILTATLSPVTVTPRVITPQQKTPITIATVPTPAPQPLPTGRQANPLPVRRLAEERVSTDERLTKLRSSWEAVVQQVRVANPVASTFLRATSPRDMNGNVMTLRMQFPLHKTFFDKPENKKIVQDAIKAVADEDVTIMCLLESAAPQTGEDLIKNVQEVFGVRVG